VQLAYYAASADLLADTNAQSVVGVASMERSAHAHPFSALHILKELFNLNLREIHKIWKLCTFCPFSTVLSFSVRSKMQKWSSASFGNLQILHNDLDVIPFCPEKYKRNFLVGESFYFCIRFPTYPHAPLL